MLADTDNGGVVGLHRKSCGAPLKVTSVACWKTGEAMERLSHRVILPSFFIDMLRAR